MKKTAAVIILGGVLFAEPLWGQKTDKGFFEVDLNAPLPSYEELLRDYAPEPVYDRRYDFSWNIGGSFDNIFARTIGAYGSSDKRLKKKNEDILLEMILSAPPEIYPYIGPYLHTVPDMSPKILNLPGIKETKGKFPERIAPQMKDIPNLEFLSPHLYFLLMPEVWPENIKAVEWQREKKENPRTIYNAKLHERVKELVPVENFYPGNKEKSKITSADLRTIFPDENSRLTSADIKAFAKTLDAVNDFSARPGMALKLLQAGQLLDAYENGMNGFSGMNMLKDMVNPCARLVQKIRILGMETEFKSIVGTEAFDVNEWAYTCDKTVKAYRKSIMSAATAAALRKIRRKERRGILPFPDKIKKAQTLTEEAVIKMYAAPAEDVAEVIKNRSLLNEKFAGGKYMLGGQPLSLSQ